MQTVDWVSAGIVLLALLIGLMLGFGKLLKIFTSGIFGIIISLILTYFFIGVVASWGFVQELMGRFVAAMESSSNGFVKFLLNIGIERVVLAIGLFCVFQLLRILIVAIVKGFVEIDNALLSAINRIFGMLFMAGIVIIVALLIFHVADLIGGSTEESLRTYLTGAFHLEWVFDHNPLKYIYTRAAAVY